MKKLRHLLLQFLIGFASFAVTTTVILLVASGIKRIFGHNQVYPSDISFEVKGCDVDDTSPSTAADTSISSHDLPGERGAKEDEIKLLPLGSTLYPEDYSDTHPYVTNTGNMNIYVFMEFSQRAFSSTSSTSTYDGSEMYTLKDSWQSSHTPRPDGLIPMFSYEINDGWTLVDEKYDAGTLYSTYAYNLALEPNSSSDPLFDYMQVTGFTTDSWRNNHGGYSAFNHIDCDLTRSHP